MKKIIALMGLCCLSTSLLAMNSSGYCELSDLWSAEVCGLRIMRPGLDAARQLALNEQLINVLKEAYKFALHGGLSDAVNHLDACTQAEVVRLLGLGADPEFKIDGKSCLYLSVAVNDEQTTKLLIGYGAVPAFRVRTLPACGESEGCVEAIVDQSFTATPVATRLETLRVLDAARAHQIGETPSRAPYLRGRVLNAIVGEPIVDHRALVWALSHGGDPNVGSYSDCGYVYPVHEAVQSLDLVAMVALLRAHASLAVRTKHFQPPLQMIETACDQWPLDGNVAHEQLYGKAAAMRMLLEGVTDATIDPAQSYTAAQLIRLGIPALCAQLIESAFAQVNILQATCDAQEIAEKTRQNGVTAYLRERQRGKC